MSDIPPPGGGVYAVKDRSWNLTSFSISGASQKRAAAAAFRLGTTPLRLWFQPPQHRPTEQVHLFWPRTFGSVPGDADSEFCCFFSVWSRNTKNRKKKKMIPDVKSADPVVLHRLGSKCLVVTATLIKTLAANAGGAACQMTSATSAARFRPLFPGFPAWPEGSIVWVYEPL